MSGVGTLNVLLPGAGLVLRDRLLPGLGLLVVAVVAVAVAVAGWLVATPGFAMQITGLCALGYVVAAALAGGVWWACERSGTDDPELLRLGHHECAAAYLRGDVQGALTSARRLVRVAPRRSGCWRLLALTAAAAGLDAEAARARRQHERLERLQS